MRTDFANTGTSKRLNESPSKKEGKSGGFKESAEGL